MKSPALLVAAMALAGSAFAAPPNDAEVLEMLRDRVEVSKRGVAIVVGIVDERGRRVIAYGPMQRGSDRMVDGDTLFEIGSITKVFTALLLADMAAKGEVGLHDPISKYVPPTVKSPRTRDITLLHLTRHTAGFPSMPDNLKASDPDHPYRDYTNEALFAFLNGYTTRRTLGTHHSYSNYGVALLGELLARRAKRDYETLLRERILEPLGMSHTMIRLTPEVREAHALGHTGRGRPMGLGGDRGMLGSGALRSTVNDLLTFAEANLGLRESHLHPAMMATHETRADRQLPDLPMGLGWFLTDVGPTRITGHSGGTAGFRSFLGLDLARKRGVVVLSNTTNDVTNLGFHLVDSAIPLFRPTAPREFREASVDAKVLDDYVGTYKLTPDAQDFVTFTRFRDQLLATNRHGTVRVFPESPTTFFTEDMEDWGTFTRDTQGRVDGFTWYRENFQRWLKRTGDKP